MKFIFRYDLNKSLLTAFSYWISKDIGHNFVSCVRVKSSSALASLLVTVTPCLSLGEALGAIGDPVVLDLLKEYRQDPVIEV